LILHKKGRQGTQLIYGGIKLIGRHICSCCIEQKVFFVPFALLTFPNLMKRLSRKECLGDSA
jgi:hypothetical protein